MVVLISFKGDGGAGTTTRVSMVVRNEGSSNANVSVSGIEAKFVRFLSFDRRVELTRMASFRCQRWNANRLGSNLTHVHYNQHWRDGNHH